MAEKKYGNVDEVELSRLERQASLIYKYIDGKYISDLLKSLSQKNSAMRVLDLGCANGNSFFRRASDFCDKIAYVGVDSSSSALEELNANFSDFYSFCALLNANVEDETFASSLLTLMQNNDIDKFDLVNISSLLLLLKNPIELLATMKKMLSKDGQLFILDIDDRNTYWQCSDPAKRSYYNKLYGKAMEICLNGKTTGNRHSGRNIVQMLRKVGFKNVEILNGTNDEVHGLCNKDMPDEDKEAFAEMLFGFIKRSVDQPDTDEETKAWFYENLQNLKQGFLDPDLTFSLGYMTFLASNSTLALTPNKNIGYGFNEN